MKLTIRQKKILTLIIKEREYMAINILSAVLKVSSRTVLREMSSIEEYLSEFACSLDKKTGLGIKILGDEKKLNELEFNLNSIEEEKIYSKQERKIVLILELLKAKEPVKIFYLTRKLNVADGTISSDLLILDEWFGQSNIKLFRKSGVGIFIEAGEREIRQAMIRLLYENLNYKNILDLVINDEKFLGKIVEEREFSIIDRDLIRIIRSSLEDLKLKKMIDIPDNLYVSIVIHIALVVQRIKKNYELEENTNYNKEIRSSKELNLARVILERIAKDFDIVIPETEIFYIADRIIGINGSEDRLLSEGEIEDIKIIFIKFIEKLEYKTGVFLSRNIEDYKEVILHIIIATKRLKSSVITRNPILDEIKDRYKDLFKIARELCISLNERLDIEFSEDEIGFITLHLGAVLEKNIREIKKVYRAIVVCPTGIGSSILLANKIEKKFKNIKIIKKASIMNMHKIDFKAEDIDFIISTVKIKEQPIKTIFVSSWLTEDDQNNINIFIEHLVSDGKSISFGENRKKDSSFNKKMKQLNEYTAGISQVLDNFFVINKEFKSIKEVINYVSEKVNFEEQKVIAVDLFKREEKGSTVLEEELIMLLHCRTKGVKDVHFGIIKLDDGIQIPNNGLEVGIKYIFVMIVPSDISENILEILSEINSRVISEPEISFGFINANEIGAYTLIDNMMKEFYESKK